MIVAMGSQLHLSSLDVHDGDMSWQMPTGLRHLDPCGLRFAWGSLASKLKVLLRCQSLSVTCRPWSAVPTSGRHGSGLLVSSRRRLKASSQDHNRVENIVASTWLHALSHCVRPAVPLVGRHGSGLLVSVGRRLTASSQDHTGS